MHFALIYYPHVGVENIDAFRRRYDPTASVIEAHMAVMFPVPASVGLQFLVEHIETALRAFSPFSIQASHGGKDLRWRRGADVPRLHHRGLLDQGTGGDS